MIKIGSATHAERPDVGSPNMVQYSPASVYGAQGSGTLQELPVPPRLHEVTQLPADRQALHVAQLLRHFIRSLHTGTAFRTLVRRSVYTRRSKPSCAPRRRAVGR